MPGIVDIDPKVLEELNIILASVLWGLAAEIFIDDMMPVILNYSGQVAVAIAQETGDIAKGIGELGPEEIAVEASLIG